MMMPTLPTSGLRTLACAAVLLVAAGPASAADDIAADIARVERATQVLRDIQSVPDNAMPDLMLDEARGILIVPDTLKVGLVFAGRRGEGLLAMRTADGGWSNPVFVNLTSGSFGLQAGVEKNDVVLVFRNPHRLDALMSGRLTLGANAGAAAGPVGRNAGRATDDRFKADIWSWSRARGLFAGVAVDGGVITIDDDANQRAYGQGTTPRMVFEQRTPQPAPAVLAAFRAALDEASTTSHNRRALEREEEERRTGAPAPHPVPPPATGT